MAPVRICLDFDGVLHDRAHPVPGMVMGPPMDLALSAVKQIMLSGHEVVVLTANKGDMKLGTQIEGERARLAYIHGWLKYYGFPPLAVTNVKPTADIYVDDKGYRFTGWSRGGATVHEILGLARGT